MQWLINNWNQSVLIVDTSWDIKKTLYDVKIGFWVETSIIHNCQIYISLIHSLVIVNFDFENMGIQISLSKLLFSYLVVSIWLEQGSFSKVWNCNIHISNIKYFHIWKCWQFWWVFEGLVIQKKSIVFWNVTLYFLDAIPVYHRILCMLWKIPSWMTTKPINIFLIYNKIIV